MTSFTRVVLITGPPGVGKTTLVTSLVARLSAKNSDSFATTSLPLRGFVTEELRDANHNRIGFDIVSVDGSVKVPLARMAGLPSTSPSVGKYTVDLKSIETKGINLICEPSNDSKDPFVYVVDEIGKMECLSQKFVDRIREVMKRQIVIATLQLVGGFIEQVKRLVPSENQFVLSVGNRDEMLHTIFDKAISIINSKS